MSVGTGCSASNRHVEKRSALGDSDGQLTIYLIEDDPDDQGLALRALRSSQLPVKVEVAKDGVEALKILGIDDDFDYAPARLPDLIICDLKMPRLRGDEVLSKAKSSPATQAVPFVMLSSSGHPSDVELCMGLGANAYCLKPVDFDSYIRCVQAIARRWLVVQQSHPECMLKCAEELV